MAVDKTAVCLYLSDDTIQQIEQLASDMNTSKSGAVSFAVGRLFDEKDAVDLPLRIKKDVGANNEIYNILDHVADALTMMMDFNPRMGNGYDEHTIKVFNVLIDRAKQGMAIIKKK